MKAVVLVGGEGTRMRPLTETIPKPLIPLIDRPFLDHVLDHLARHGVHEVLLSSSYLVDAFSGFIEARHGDPAVTWITEASPLGTAGAVANAVAHGAGIRETFLALNGDILTDLDLTAMLAFHRERQAAATIALAPAEDARPYGLVELRDDGGVLEFKEKPQGRGAIPGPVNAGTYMLEPQALQIPTIRPVSIEHETFPEMIRSGIPVYGFVSRAYWMDLGTPQKYLRATFDALEGRVRGLAYASPHVDGTARVSLRAHLGRWVVVGPGARVEDGAEVEDSVLLAGSVVREGARIRDSILGPGAAVAEGATVMDAVLAEGARVEAQVWSQGARLSAGQTLSLHQPV
jgi:mannose-1-phosphate guanylyltransferase